MNKYRCPAPKCLKNKKGICCNECDKKDYCADECLNDVKKCGAVKI